ncbi:hypothetical protein IWX81_002566 [Salinibacterium sp. CAN_S4]|uniref:hypothetical protein n=1 Tax=Salinibacterium sp. CAN_S4 TaxID=2787727 RepID=UPI0018EF5C6D
MTTSQGVADKAIALGFDTVTTVQHVAGDIALAISDTYRLKPLKFWVVAGAVAIAVLTTVAVARR